MASYNGDADKASAVLRRNMSGAPTTPTAPRYAPSNDNDRRASSRFSRFPRRVGIKSASTVSVPLAVVIGFPILILIVIFMLFMRHPPPAGRMLMPPGSPPSIRKISEKHDKVFVTGCLEPAVQKPRANAAFVVLARNKELDGVVQSIRSIERHFNRWFHYPYVFLNDREFNSTFKETVQRYTSGTVEFGTIGREHWGYPEWVDVNAAKEAIALQGDQAIMYGGMESYHHMCRFYSGMFYKHELLQKYKWYWRLEPDVKYFCDITYDPFIKMEENNKVYGFTIAVKELRETVPNIFRYASAYKRMNNITSQGMWEMFLQKPEKDPNVFEVKEEPKKLEKPKSWFPRDILEPGPEHEEDEEAKLEDMEGEQYNLCHFWSNFEIARLDWFRSKEYNDFFEMMDRSGGFWTERWGDAPIHSLATGVLLPVSAVHYFRDIGYRHTTIQHCPANAPGQQLPRPRYLEATTPDPRVRVEEDHYWEQWDREKENGVGCRCRCDTDVVEVEGKEGTCLPEWVEVAGGWASP